MRRSIRSGATMVAAALILSACFDRNGDGDQAEPPTPEIESDDAEPAAEEPEPEPEPEDDVDGPPEPDDTDEADDDPTAASAALPDGAVETCADLAGYTDVDATSATDELIATLAEPSGAFRADADLNALTKALLLVDANEPELPRTRYRVRYSTVAQDTQQAVPTEVVLVERFNLGPTVRDELLESQDESTVGPPEAFGVGPHVAYCFEMQTIQAMTADAYAVSRAEFDDATAAATTCFGASCLDTASVPEQATDWQDGDQLDLPGTVYEPLQDGAPGPAVALDLALVQSGVASFDGSDISWHGFEPREGVAPGEPFVEVVADVGLGQDSGVDLALREGHIMDHTMEAAWQRVMGIPGAPDPMVFSAFAIEERTAG